MAGWLAGWLAQWLYCHSVAYLASRDLLRFQISWNSKIGRVWQKVHSEVISTQNLILQSGTMYSLHSMISHMGENTQSGHYNLLLFEDDENVLLDDSTISYMDNYPQEMNKESYVCIYKADWCIESLAINLFRLHVFLFIFFIGMLTVIGLKVNKLGWATLNLRLRQLAWTPG